MIGIPIGLALANVGEWYMHKYVLHSLGKRKGSFWSFHWHEHHRESRTNGMVDRDYQRPATEWNAQSKEIAALGAATVAVLPLAPVAPFLVGTLAYSAINYYRKHKRAHLDPEWARQHLPWHYDHHMGPNQHANWCVTRPWFDIVRGTRERYAGTEREWRDRQRRAQRAERQAQRAERQAQSAEREAQSAARAAAEPA